MASRNAQPWAPPSTKAQSIALRARQPGNRHDERSGNESESDILPASNTNYLRIHQGELNAESDDVVARAPTTVLSRLKALIMSTNPLLLIRSSPALGTGSYGAIPAYQPGQEPDSSSDADDEDRDQGSRREKRHDKVVQSADCLRPRQSSSIFGPTDGQSSRMCGKARRASSSGAEVGIGLHPNTSFAIGGGSLPESTFVEDQRPPKGSGSDSSSLGG